MVDGAHSLVALVAFAWLFLCFFLALLGSFVPGVGEWRLLLVALAAWSLYKVSFSPTLSPGSSVPGVGEWRPLLVALWLGRFPCWSCA